jgi:hypothetical protein
MEHKNSNNPAMVCSTKQYKRRKQSTHIELIRTPAVFVCLDVLTPLQANVGALLEIMSQFDTT